MRRIDKYEPYAGGFRAPLAEDFEITSNPVGVGLDPNGRVVVGGDLPIVGVICPPENMFAGDVVDVMTAGEIVDVEGLTAGTIITANATTGVISDAAPSSTEIQIGVTVEATRLVVRV